MANLCIKTPSSASLVLIFQLLVSRPRPNGDEGDGGGDGNVGNGNGGGSSCGDGDGGGVGGPSFVPVDHMRKCRFSSFIHSSLTFLPTLQFLPGQ